MQIRMTQTQFDTVAARLKETQGIVLKGTAGTISKMGVKAAYTFDGDTLGIEILEKPFMVSREFVEGKLAEWLAAGH